MFLPRLRRRPRQREDHHQQAERGDHHEVVQDGSEHGRGEAAPRDLVMEQWRCTLFLKDRGVAARGWLIEVMKCVDLVGSETFTLDDVYAFEDRLKALYPGNRNVRPKIRQQLQVLRDQGYLDFVGCGRYRLRRLS